MARIENHKYSIEEAFRECFYIVPDYQREYVWTDKEVHQLLEDIDEQIDAGTTREYFIGTVLVSPTDQKNHYEVIDGQQRLTTFFLLLCALKHLFQGEPQRQTVSGLISTSYTDSDGETRTSLKLEPRYENAGEVVTKLVELDADPQTARAGIQSAGIASFGSLENLVSAYSTLYRYANKPFEFVRKVIRNVEHYLAFSNGLGNDGKPSLAMDSLKRLAGGAFSLHYVLLLAAANFPKPLFDHFVAQLESFLFYYIFTKTPTKDLERSFSQWADELRAIAAATDPVKQKVQLNAFIADRFDTNMAGKSQELVDALRRFTLYSMQQYRTRYLLARLTQHVEMAFSGLKTPGSLEPFTKLEIEHILPDNPTAELRGKWATENPGTAYDDYKNRLGNLTLLEKPINIVAGNDFYTEKQAEYRKSGNYLTRSLVELTSVGQNTSISRINEKLKAFPAWDAKAIEARHGLLITLAQDVWKTSPIDV